MSEVAAGLRLAPATVRAGVLAAIAAALGGLALAFVDTGAPTPSASGGAAAFGELPLAFEPAPDGAGADFVARGPGYAAALTRDGAALALTNSRRAGLGIKIGLAGASAGAPRALSKLPGEVNYLVGDRSRWRTGVPTYERVLYPSAWPGIDVLWHGDGSRLEYDFRLAPGADPDRIALRLRGADSVRVAGNGDLVLRAGEERLRQRAPVAFQEIDGEHRAVAARYVARGDRVTFALGNYDRSRPLVIDPIVLTYSTFLGGSGIDAGTAIAVDDSGAAYVVGGTASSDFPTQDALVPTSQGDRDAFLAKLAPDGKSVLYSTYWGGSGGDEAASVALGTDGTVYVAGITGSTDLPVSPGAFQPAFGGGANDGFVSRFAPDGQGIEYSTYLGGGTNDSVQDIAIDADGNAYLTGYTSAADFPVTPGAVQPVVSGERDAFATKLSPDGTSLIYSTYIGGGAQDIGHAIGVDDAGAAIVVGETRSADFPTPSAMDSSLGGSQDGFVTRLAPSGTAYEYSTYLGGTDDDAVYGVALDPTGATYVGGWTDSSDFPVTSRAAAETFGGVSDAFAAKLTADGQSIVYASYLGGDDVDLALEIAVDDSGALYLAGLTASPDFPVTHGPVKPPDGFGDGFVTRLDPSGSTFTHSTPLGGSTVDEADGLAVGAEGAAYVTGFTTSDDFPITPGAFDATRDDIDAFVVTISVAPNPTTAEVSCAPDPVASGAEATCTVTVTDTAERPMNPVGTVELATAAAGTFTGSGSCELTPDATPATSSCSLGYSSAVSGAQRIDAAYRGSLDHLPSTGQATLSVAPVSTCGGVPVTIEAGPGGTLRGTPGDDVIRGTAGPDRILAGAGNDIVCGGGGRDTLKGGPGADRLKGNEGRDRLRGNGGPDVLIGGPGRDDLHGGGGKDRCGRANRDKRRTCER